MDEQAKHTPTPWSVGEMEMSRKDWAALGAHGTLQIVRRGSDVIAAVWAEDGVEEKDNADFITRACNTHDDLVAALKHCLREHGGFHIAGESERLARAALAKAEAN